MSRASSTSTRRSTRGRTSTAPAARRGRAHRVSSSRSSTTHSSAMLATSCAGCGCEPTSQRPRRSRCKARRNGCAPTRRRASATRTSRSRTPWRSRRVVAVGAATAATHPPRRSVIGDVATTARAVGGRRRAPDRGLGAANRPLPATARLSGRASRSAGKALILWGIPSWLGRGHSGRSIERMLHTRLGTTTLGSMQRFLLDANVLIPLEPTGPEEAERDTPLAVGIVERATRRGFHLLVHPETIRELASDPDPSRRVTRRVLLDKYQELADPPVIDHVEGVLGATAPGSNDWVDHNLLAAVAGDAVHYLITNDNGMHRKARRLGLTPDRLLTIADARALLGTLVNSPQRPPPQVTTRALHALRRDDPIFKSLHDDYPDFDGWFERVSRQGREAWVIESSGDGYAGICIWKADDDEYRLGGKVMKVSTFKVSEEHRGRRYGELLLKALFSELHANRYDHVWLTAFDRHAELISMVEDFGFERLPVQTDLGELVMVKHLKPTDDALHDSVQYHRRFGPPAVHPSLPGGVYVVPIRPRYHTRLFPDHDRQPPRLLPDDDPFGNALRKAYLSQSGIKPLPPGATILFYRSDDWQGISAVGVVEESRRSDDASEVAAFAGQRTVYSFEEIEAMSGGGALAILFRQDRLLDPPWPLDELVTAGVLNAAPQSITQVRGEDGILWLTDRLAASF
ncbi:MAG: GNAT family N-acetyltransferase [Chloroflexi bacterium]|nr:GNAT family N-acetyltransferase [Chloroflexota bacterium]